MKSSVQLSQGRIDYTEDGEGPTVVLLHGLLVNGSLWRKVAPQLSRQARVIVPTLPLGSHETAMNEDADLSVPGVARLIAEFLEALELTDVTLVGNDTGGALAQVVATEHPARIGRLVLTSCDAFDNFPPRMFAGLLVAARLPGGLTALGMTLRLKPLWRTPLAFGWLAKRPIDEAVVREWLAPGRRPEIRRDVAKVLRSVGKQHTLRAAEKLRDFDRPLLCAWASDDRFMPVEHAHRLAALVPDGRVELIQDSYTFTPEDQPAALAKLIEEFIAPGYSPLANLPSQSASGGLT
jgi:pimeloyl-ACP methyl ester carboxylesterase